MNLSNQIEQARVRISTRNTENLYQISNWIKQDFPSEVRNLNDTINIMIEFFVEFVYDPAQTNQQGIGAVISQYEKMAAELKNQPVKSKLSAIEDKLDMMLLLGLNDFAIDKDLPAEIRADMISPMKQGGTAYAAYSKLQGIEERHKKRVVNKNRDGVMR